MGNKIITGVCIAVLSFSFFACKKNTYGEDLKAEKILIDEFIQREGIKVLDEFPTDSFAESEYVKTSSGLYFRMEKQADDTTAKVEVGDIVSVKYLEYTLTTTPDTANFWDTQESPYLQEFVYDGTSTVFSQAFQEAVSYMKYSGTEAKLIVPDKIGFYSTDMLVIPYGYHLKILFRKNMIPGNDTSKQQ